MNRQPKLEELIAKQDSLLEDMNVAKDSGEVSKNTFYGFTEKSEEIRGAFEMDVLQEMRGLPLKNATVGNLKIKFEQKEREINDLLTELEGLRGPLNSEGGKRRKRRNSRKRRKGSKSRKSRSSRTRRNN